METCRLCSQIAQLEGAFCASCRRAHGPRTAAFLARAQVDPSFANATLARLAPDARQRMLAAMSRQYVGNGPGLRKAIPRPEVSHRRRISA
ncbi:MAG TPA: hypothetical protein VM686_05295 [Polyangiaceae bacterium]|nr:hypothetical protein [Polyangiaceae bacterium]